jgi:anti-sigma-K factor RskA
MNLQQMIESAILDAMGLLDDSEREQFERAFRTASPVIQAQIRREQTRLSQIEALLPDVTPPASLRAAVVDAVRRQIEAGQTASGQFVAPELLRSNRVSPWWRTGTLAMAAASVVLGFATIRFASSAQDLSSRMKNDDLIAQVTGKIGAAYVRDVLFDQGTKRVVLSPNSSGFKGQASLFVSPSWEEARFFYNGLKTSNGRVYKLAIVDENDHIVNVIKTLTPEDGLQGVAVAIDAHAKGRIAILAADGNGSEAVLGAGELPGML